MTQTIELSWSEVERRARTVAEMVIRDRAGLSPPVLYGVPNGGVYAAQAVAAAMQMRRPVLCEVPAEATHVIDDIIDSGATQRMFRDTIDGPLFGRPPIPFYALVDKQGDDREWKDCWISFPWERMKREDGPQDAVRRLIQYIGDNPERPGLKNTPDRVVRSYAELFGGYKQDPAAVLKTFDEPCDEMVLLKGIEFFSTCEHHMLPFTGVAHVAYLPCKGKVAGLSKLARLVEVFARRLQVQERLTRQVTDALTVHLEPLGAACMIEAKHHCVCSRGVGKQDSVMVTSSLTGAFREPEVRAEFFSLIGK